MGLLCSKVTFDIFKLLNPSMSFTNGDLERLPYIVHDKKPEVDNLVAKCVGMSQGDAAGSETAWDFKQNMLTLWGMAATEQQKTVAEAYAMLREDWKKKTVEMRKLEMENNRIFIEAYGLTDEMKPDVPWNEISLTCNPWYRYGEKNAADGDEFPLDETLEKKLRTDTIKELVSYAVGCLMGRYSLDKEGLILASQGETLEDYWQKVGVEKTAATLQPDDDGILPVIVGANAFADDAKNRVTEFVRVVFGAENLNANLNFIEECLGTTLESYLAKEFWKDHKKMYQNRPIYWLFSSKKGAFQCLVYMHRMDAYTATKVRNDYLLKHIEFLRTRIAADTARSADLSAQERRDLKKMQQALDECLEYDGRLHVVADRMQPIDLDDGVVVNYAKFGDVLAKLK